MITDTFVCKINSYFLYILSLKIHTMYNFLYLIVPLKYKCSKLQYFFLKLITWLIVNIKKKQFIINVNTIFYIK